MTDTRLVGKLSIVGTPLGNLEDMTFRAVRTLQEADFIAAEDTRHTRKLLAHFAITGKTVFSYHEHNERTSAQMIIDRVLAGESGAIVSDAGMPGISDPGQEVIEQAIAQDIPIEIVPGPSAVITALCGSGLGMRYFSFYGFLPRDGKDRRIFLEAIVRQESTLVFYEAPHRVGKVLADMYRVFGDREVVIARELTKIHEMFHRGHLRDHEQLIAQEHLRGEMVIVVAGISKDVQQEEEEVLPPIVDHVKLLVEQGLPKKEAMREVAKRHQLSRRDVYQAWLDQEDEN